MILHIDMDAFYASVEQLDNPELKGKCVIVGRSSRGVVTAASYEARKYGVHSAMPVFQAKRKCPGGTFLPPRMKRYKEISKKLMSLLRDFSPLVEPVSIDEAYVDITGCERLHGQPRQIAIHIKKKIKESLNLTCSVGIAPNKFLAKIASDMDKPDGFTIISPDKVIPFIESLPIYKVPGVGKKMNRRLEALGIKTLGDVRKCPEKIISQQLGKFGQRLIKLSAGIDDAPVRPASVHKSVSTEKTLPEDTDDIALLKKYLMMQAEEVGSELRRLEIKVRTITLKLKDADFKQVTRSVTVALPTQSSETIYRAAERLLLDYRLTKKVRLIGVGTSDFLSAAVPVQRDLFEDKRQKSYRWEAVDKTLDTITTRFGKGVIKRATLHNPKQKD
jgi:DNA polymerase-4